MPGLWDVRVSLPHGYLASRWPNLTFDTGPQVLLTALPETRCHTQSEMQAVSRVDDAASR